MFNIRKRKRHHLSKVHILRYIYLRPRFWMKNMWTVNHVVISNYLFWLYVSSALSLTSILVCNAPYIKMYWHINEETKMEMGMVTVKVFKYFLKIRLRIQLWLKIARALEYTEWWSRSHAFWPSVCSHKSNDEKNSHHDFSD